MVACVCVCACICRAYLYLLYQNNRCEYVVISSREKKITNWFESYSFIAFSYKINADTASFVGLFELKYKNLLSIWHPVILMGSTVACLQKRNIKEIQNTNVQKYLETRQRLANFVKHQNDQSR